MKVVSRKSRIACALSLATLSALSSQALGASASWAAAASGVWNSAGNWSPASVPNGAGDNATISIGGTYTVTLNTNQTVNTLAISGPGATLNHSAGTLSAVNINISGGSYTLAGGTISGANISTSGSGTLFFANNGANVFANNTTYNGNLVLPSTGRLRLQSGSTFTGAAGTINSNAVLSYEQTATVTGKTISVENFGVFAIDGANQLTLASNTTVLGNSGAQFGVPFNVFGDNLLVNNGTIQAQVGQFSVNPINLTNNGFMAAGAGSRLSVRSSGSFSNAGTLQASGGGSVTINAFENFTWNNSAAGRVRVADATSSVFLDGNWSNNGTLILNQGTLSLGGTFTRAGIGTITRTGGTIDIAGFMDNSGGTLTLNATTGDYRMNGGIISGGTITTGGGGTLTFANTGGNRLAGNAVLVGDLVINNAGRIRLQSGSSFTGANGTLLNSSIMSYEQNGTLSGKTFTLDNSALLAVEGGFSLNLAATSTVRGANGSNFGTPFHTGGASTLVNSGTIQATAGQFIVNPNTLVNNSIMSALSGSRLSIRTSGSFSNAGTLEASGGGSITINLFDNFTWNNSPTGRIRVADATSSVFLDGNWSNNGTLILNQGTLGLGGTFTRAGIGTITRTAGTIDLFGFMDNSGGTLLLNATTGDYRLNGGVISGGTITSGGATLLFANNGLNRFANNLVYVGDMILNTNGRLRLQSGSSFTGSNGTFLNSSVFGYEQTGTLSGKTFTVEGNSVFSVEGSNTLTIGTTTTVRGGTNSTFGPTFNLGGVNGVINNGTIHTTTGQLNVNPNNLINNSLMSAGAATRLNVRASGSFSNAGTVQVSGGGSITINWFDPFTWSNSSAGVIRVADAASSVFFGGNWTNAGTVVLNQGTLALDGTFTRGGIGTINRTGGIVDILGFLDNSGGTLTPNATTGDYRLNGGVITGGTITSTGGGTMLFANNGNNRFANNLVFVGDLALNAGRLRLQTGSSFSGSSGTLLAGSVLGYEQNGALNGKTITMNNSTLAVEGGFSLTLGATSTVRGSGSVGQTFATTGTSTLINNGTIEASLPAAQLLVSPTLFTNNGTLIASNGGRLNLGLTTNFGSDPGRLIATGPGSVLTIPGGTYTVSQSARALNHGLILLQGNFTKAATFDASGRFVFDYTGTSPFAAIKADIFSGYAGGSWNGAGINSSAAAVTPRTAVGYAEASVAVGTLGGVFAGVSVDATSVLVRYTLAGDTNLDGDVDIGDFALLAANFNQPSQWSTGDTNYDNLTNISDFALLAANFNQTLGTADLPRSASVPEPVSCGLLATVAVALQSRWRRR